MRETRWPWVWRVLAVGVTGYLLAFPFTPNPAAVNFETAFALHPGQVQIEQAAQVIIAQYPQHVVGACSPYARMMLGTNFADTTRIQETIDLVNSDNQRPVMVLWDAHFTVVEAGLQPTDFTAEQGWKQVQAFASGPDQAHDAPSAILFERLPAKP